MENMFGEREKKNQEVESGIYGIRFCFWIQNFTHSSDKAEWVSSHNVHSQLIKKLVAQLSCGDAYIIHNVLTARKKNSFSIIVDEKWEWECERNLGMMRRILDTDFLETDSLVINSLKMN